MAWLSSFMPASPHVQLAVVMASCTVCGLIDTASLVPLYAVAPYEMQRVVGMGPWMLGRSVGLLVPLLLLHFASTSRWCGPSMSVEESGSETAAVQGAFLSAWPSLCSLPLLPHATSRPSFSSSPMSRRDSPTAPSVGFPVACGALSSAAFFLVHHGLPVWSGSNWIFASYPNDHYASLTAYVPVAFAVGFIEITERAGRREGERWMRSGCCSESALWIVGLVLANCGQFVAISNVLQRT